MNDVDRILDRIRTNASLLSAYHRKRYITLKSRLKYYRIPILVISSVNSVAAVSLTGFMSQTYVSLLNMFLSLLVGIIGSIEMFYQITRQMEVELVGSKDFYVLSIDIYKYLALDKSKRSGEEKIFLADCWTRYTKLVETSYILKKKIEDKLSELPDTPLVASSSSTELFVDTSSDGSP